MKGIGGHTLPNRGATDIWLTPPEVVGALGAFDLDPCAAPDPRPWDTARTHWPSNGLLREWSGRIWLNPPYSAAAAWIEKLANHGDGIAILFARTETELFRRFVWPRASALLFLSGRLHFYRPCGTRAKGNAGGPSVLVAYGERNAAILKTSGLSGAYVTSVQFPGDTHAP